MGTVTGLTAAAMEAIRDGSITAVDLVGPNLNLVITYFDGTTEDLGPVKGADGSNGLTPALSAASTSSLTVGTGSKTFALSPSINVAFPIGAVVRAVGASPANYMVGVVTASSASSVTLNVTETGGSGTLASWTLAIGAFGTVASTVQFARKTADQVRSASSTLVDAADLSVAVVAGSTYLLRMGLFLIASSTTPDAKIGFTFPAGTLKIGGVRAGTNLASDGSTTDVVLTHPGAMTSGSTSIVVGVSTVATLAILEGLYVCTTSGTLQMMVAQNTATGTTTLQADSWLRAERVV